MKVIACKGYELEKERPNTSEDMFNRSEVTYRVEGVERTFHLLYLRYYDEKFTDWTPYEQNPLFTVEDREVYFKDIVALAALMTKPEYRQRKRVYINTETEFSKLFAKADFEKIEGAFHKLVKKGSTELEFALAE